MPNEAMVRVEGATFSMGSGEFYADERPVHERTLDAFLIDRTAVTNAEFAAFVEATGYVTTAERPLDPADFPGVPAEQLIAGAMVFVASDRPLDLSDWRQWWSWAPGAHWRAPLGEGSTLKGRERHPVVQVSYEDAAAYAAWRGCRLPTEAEHEYAAAGGASGQPFAWGQEPYPAGEPQANTWIGRFPYDNQGRFGAGTAPVGSFPANSYGLLDMIGNVWEWTSDYYAPMHLPPAAAAGPGATGAALPLASAEPGSQIPRRVLTGGSYLCSPDYCLRFRPAARSPQAEDTATTHIGFRCARDA